MLCVPSRAAQMHDPHCASQPAPAMLVCSVSLSTPPAGPHHSLCSGSRVALDVARALAFLHHLGIAHRDVKSAVSE